MSSSIPSQYGEAVELFHKDLSLAEDDSLSRMRAEHSLKNLLLVAKVYLGEELSISDRIKLLDDISGAVNLFDGRITNLNYLSKLTLALNSVNAIYSDSSNPVQYQECIAALRNTKREKESVEDLLFKTFSAFFSSLLRDQIRDENYIKSIDRLYSNLSRRLANCSFDSDLRSATHASGEINEQQ